MQNPLGPLDVIVTSGDRPDPAINLEFPGLLEVLVNYFRSREPDDLAPALREGMQFTRFVCLPLPRIYVATTLDALRDDTDRYFQAFMASCHEIRVPDETEPMRPRKVIQAGRGAMRATDDWFDTVAARFGFDAVYEVGGIAYQRARLPEGARGQFRPVRLGGQ